MVLVDLGSSSWYELEGAMLGLVDLRARRRLHEASSVDVFAMIACGQRVFACTAQEVGCVLVSIVCCISL